MTMERENRETKAPCRLNPSERIEYPALGTTRSKLLASLTAAVYVFVTILSMAAQVIGTPHFASQAILAAAQVVSCTPLSCLGTLARVPARIPNRACNSSSTDSGVYHTLIMQRRTNMFNFEANQDWATAQKIGAYILLITSICMFIRYTGIAPAGIIDHILPILFAACSAASFVMYRSIRDRSTRTSDSGSKIYLFTAVTMIIVAVINFIQAMGF